MNVRDARTRTNRKVLLLGVAVSLGLHTWALTALTFDPADMFGPADRPQAAVPVEEFTVPELELLQVVVVEDEVEPLTMPTAERPLLADAAPAPNPEPDAATQEVASRVPAPSESAEPAAAFASAPMESAPAPTLAEIIEAGLSSRAEIAVAPQLPGQRAIDGWSPVEAVALQTGQDQAEEEGTDGSSFWRRIGRTFGIGGDRICRIIPKDAGKTGS